MESTTENLRDFSSESIRSRMLRNAARLWGVEGNEIESSFDPLVSMLIESCSIEIAKINSEISSSQTRILNRLAQLLSPETLTGARPSHAIVHARSIDPVLLLNNTIQLYYLRKNTSTSILNKDVNEQIYFSPVSPSSIFDAEIRYMASGNLLFEYKSPNQKDIIAEAVKDGSTASNVLWLGIEGSLKITSLKNFSFFFDWKNDPEKNLYYNLLPLTKLFLSDRQLEIQQGNNSVNADDTDELKSYLTSQFDISKRIEDEIKEIYKKSFISISADQGDINLNFIRQRYPSEFEKMFNEKHLSKMQGNYIWLKVVFPNSFPLQALPDTYVSLNCFPIVNRKLNKFNYRLQSSLNIVPLSTEDYFLDLKSVQSADGTPYINNPLNSGIKNEAGYFTMRNGGVERFDSRNAREFITYFLDLMRDESAAFSSLGNEFLSSNIRQLDQIIAQFEQRIESKGNNSPVSNYLMINSRGQGENIYLQFWSTNGTTANHIKASSKLNLSTGNELRSEGLMMMTTSFGAKDPLDDNEKLSAYKKALLTHDRIVTIQDIKLTCYYELGELIENVEVKKGWQQGIKEKEGFMRTLEIILTPSPRKDNNAEEWKLICEELKVKLEKRSSFMIPLVIKTKDKT